MILFTLLKARLRRWALTSRPCHLVDVSRSQRPEDIDYHALKRQGIVGVYIRVSAGSLTVDRAAKEHARLAKEAGLLIGYYHAVTPDPHERDPEREAEFFLGLRAELPEPDLCDAVDVEKGRKDKKLNLAEWLTRWVLHWRAAQDGEFPVLYCTPSYLKHLRRHGYEHEGPLWLAHWTLGGEKAPLYTLKDQARAPAPAFDADLWQWTSSGKLQGYGKRLDLDYAPRGLGAFLRR